jgi:hypothetical protein
MATTVAIGGADTGLLFVGEDKTLRLELLDTNDATVIAAGGGNPVNMAGWALVFDVRNKDNSPDPAILSKTPTVAGVFNAARNLNTQRAVVILTDDDLNLFKGSNLPVGAKTYRHSWKRTTADSETVLARGDFAPEKATAP